MPARFTRGLVALLVGGCALVGLGLASMAAAHPTAPGMSASAMANAFVWAIDTERAQHGLAPLVVDPTIADRAQLWSGGMALFNTLVEDRFFGTELAATDPGWRSGGENVGVGPSATSLEAAFMASPAHRDNILGGYTHVGVGVFVDGFGRIWVTERFYT